MIEMTKTKFRFEKRPELKNPIVVEGLPGIGYVGKLALDHLSEELGAEKFAEMTSPYFPHHVTMNSDGVLEPVKVEFYLVSKDNIDLVLIAGDVQAASSKGHYEVTNTILDFAEELGVETIYTLGGYATGEHTSSKPRVVGASSDEEVLEVYEKYDIGVEEGSGPVLGVSGLLIALGKRRGIEGTALLGETHGMLVDHRSAQAVLEVLTDILDLSVDMSKLEERAEKTEEILSKLRREQKLHEATDLGTEDEELSYIG